MYYVVGIIVLTFIGDLVIIDKYQMAASFSIYWGLDHPGHP